MHVLVVEDDRRVCFALTALLRRHGFEVSVAHDRRSALEVAAGQPPHIVLLDLGLPDGDGFQVCSRLRQMSDMAIIIVTARGDVQSRIHGLNLGADDYVVKPYDFRELLARISAVTRRGPSTGPRTEADPGGSHITAGSMRIDLSARRVTVWGAEVELTRKEFEVLALLAATPGVVVRRERLLSQIWQTNWAGAGRTLEVHIGSLRSKIGIPELIETVRGVGYRLHAKR
jgi:DNA-binding response OmpR family regulator